MRRFPYDTAVFLPYDTAVFLSARKADHRTGVIVSPDPVFDRVDALQRIDPLDAVGILLD